MSDCLERSDTEYRKRDSGDVAVSICKFTFVLTTASAVIPETSGTVSGEGFGFCPGVEPFGLALPLESRTSCSLLLASDSARQIEASDCFAKIFPLADLELT